jgi:branched-chain amino acid transport system ATP-binding protein
MTRAIDIIRDEHRAIASVLSSLTAVIAVIEAGKTEPDFELLDMMIFYIEAMPETLHHPKEDSYIYDPLTRGMPEQDPAIEQIHEEHERGHHLGRQLVSSLLAYRVLGAAAFPAFAAAVRSYADLQWEHMGKEERHLLPLARDRLGAADWQRIDEAFLANERDPVKAEQRKVFRELFRRLAAHTPDPFGR